MAEQVISLTNKKKIPMSVPNGQGKLIRMEPGETQLVRGDFEYFRRMPAQGMNGLVVKLVEGKSRLVEADKKIQDDVRLVRVTNHRNIPMVLATGVGRKSVRIEARQTSEPFLGKVSVIKQMTGISVRPVEEKSGPAPKTEPEKTEPEKTAPEKTEPEKTEPEKTEPEPAKTESGPAADGSGKIEVRGEGNLRNGATEEAKAIARQAAEDEKKAKAEAEANDPLVKQRRDLALPATSEEWGVHSQQLTWPDVRGIAKELGIKTSNLNKEELLAEITKKLYPET